MRLRCMASPSSGRNTQPTRPASTLGRTGDSSTHVGVAPGRGAGARMEGVGNAAAPIARRCRAAGSGWCRAPRRSLRAPRSVSKCTTCMSPCTPASVRPAQTVVTGCAANWVSACFQLVLHGAARRLALPAFVGLPVVADAESQPHWRAFKEVRGSADFGEKSLGPVLEVAGGLGQDFLGQAACAIRVADGVELLGQRQLGGQRVAAGVVEAAWRSGTRPACSPAPRPCRGRWLRRAAAVGSPGRSSDSAPRSNSIMPASAAGAAAAAAGCGGFWRRGSRSSGCSRRA